MAFSSATAYLVVKSTAGTHYFLQGGLYYNVDSPNAEVTAAAVGALAQTFASPGSAGGGGATTVADGADTATGAVADAAATAGGTGTVSAKLRRISTQLPSAVGQTTKSASMPVALASDDALLSLVGAPTAGTQSNVASSASDVTILASNSSRKGFYVFNDSTQVLYLLLSNATSSATVFTQKMAAGDSFSAAPGTYTGIVKGIWASANGSARVTEWA